MGKFGDDLYIFRGAQPDGVGYLSLRNQLSVRTVINLRKFHDESEIVERMGMKSFSFPMTVFREIPREKIHEILDIMKNPSNFPVFVHCLQGHDRTGAICACYRIREDGWTLEEAREEMISYGFNRLWEEMKDSIEAFAKGGCRNE